MGRRRFPRCQTLKLGNYQSDWEELVTSSLTSCTVRISIKLPSPTPPPTPSQEVACDPSQANQNLSLLETESWLGDRINNKQRYLKLCTLKGLPIGSHFPGRRQPLVLVLRTDHLATLTHFHYFPLFLNSPEWEYVTCRQTTLTGAEDGCRTDGGKVKWREQKFLFIPCLS